MYLTIFQVGCMYFTEAYMLSDEFNNLSFIRKCFYLALWSKIHLYKYISCWLITEGALITFGKLLKVFNLLRDRKWLIDLRFSQTTSKLLSYEIKFDIQYKGFPWKSIYLKSTWKKAVLSWVTKVPWLWWFWIFFRYFSQRQGQ